MGSHVPRPLAAQNLKGPRAEFSLFFVSLARNMLENVILVSISMFFGSRSSKIYSMTLKFLFPKQAEIHTVAFKVNDLEFQGHVIEIENSNYHLWIP